MNPSDVTIITVAGVLQVCVAGYGLWLNRQFGTPKVGWSIFGAFALLAITHLSESIQQFNQPHEFVVRIELVYALTSFLLLLGMAHIQSLFKERQRMECQARKMETIGQLAVGIAHDFNNIIAVVEGYASLLLRKPQDKDTASQLTQIEAAAKRASALIRQLLAFGKHRPGEIQLLDLNAVTADLVVMLHQLLGSKIKIENVPGDDLPAILGDKNMIEEIIVNLAVNARDAMPNGGKLIISAETVTVDKVHASRKRDARPGQFACIRVCDTGDGIPPKVLGRIFEPFFTTKGEGKGTGLGLATVQRIAKEHSGWVEVQSEVGVGTEFSVFFPCAPRPAVAREKLDASRRAPALTNLREAVKV